MTAVYQAPIKRIRATKAAVEAWREAAEEPERDIITRLVGKIARKRLR